MNDDPVYSGVGRQSSQEQAPQLPPPSSDSDEGDGEGPVDGEGDGGEGGDGDGDVVGVPPAEHQKDPHPRQLDSVEAQCPSAGEMHVPSFLSAPQPLASLGQWQQ